MTWDQVRRIVEARLYEWGARRHEEPGTPISHAYQVPTLAPKGSHGPSQPERWVMSRAQVIEMDVLVQRLPLAEGRLVRWRYAELASWRHVAKRLHVSYSEVWRIRDRALAMLGQALGFAWEQESENPAA